MPLPPTQNTLPRSLTTLSSPVSISSGPNQYGQSQNPGRWGAAPQRQDDQGLVDHDMEAKRQWRLLVSRRWRREQTVFKNVNDLATKMKTRVYLIFQHEGEEKVQVYNSHPMQDCITDFKYLVTTCLNMTKSKIRITDDVAQRWSSSTQGPLSGPRRPWPKCSRRSAVKLKRACTRLPSLSRTRRSVVSMRCAQIDATRTQRNPQAQRPQRHPQSRRIRTQSNPSMIVHGVSSTKSTCATGTIRFGMTRVTPSKLPTMVTAFILRTSQKPPLRPRWVVMLAAQGILGRTLPPPRAHRQLTSRVLSTRQASCSPSWTQTLGWRPLGLTFQDSTEVESRRRGPNARGIAGCTQVVVRYTLTYTRLR